MLKAPLHPVPKSSAPPNSMNKLTLTSQQLFITGLDFFFISVRVKYTSLLFSAELLMHSERVTRHTKGINQSLSDLKLHFSNMTEEHNALSNKFREDIEALEVVFINATKSSK